MLQYLTPTTLEELYKDLDEARLYLLNGVSADNLIKRAAEYSKINDEIAKIEAQYEALTGEQLWAKTTLTITT